MLLPDAYMNHNYYFGFLFRDSITGQPTSQLSQSSFCMFLSFQEAINRRREETVMAVSKSLPSEGKEEMCGKDIPSEWHDSPSHQSFKKAPFTWSQVLEDSDKSLPLTEEWQLHVMISVIYIYIFNFSYILFIKYTIL